MMYNPYKYYLSHYNDEGNLIDTDIFNELPEAVQTLVDAIKQNTLVTLSNKEKCFGELTSSEREDAQHNIMSMPELGKDGVNDVMGDFFVDEVIHYLTVSQIKGLIKIKLKEENEQEKDNEK